MVSTVSLIANPQIISAVQPATPPTVINRRDLNRKILRAVTLPKKLSLLHTGLIRSSRMRAPAFGAFGRISAAGVCRISLRQASAVATPTPTMNNRMPAVPYPQSYSSRTSGNIYSPLITISRNAGIPRNPTSRPMPPPTRQASNANSKYRRETTMPP